MWILLQGGQVVQQSGIQCFNCKEFGHFAKECRKPKRVKDSTYHKEKCWKHITVNGKDSGGPNAGSAQDAEPLEQDDQNDVECDDERVALANLIANLKLDVDENKKIQKQLKKANATLTQELTECKSILAETSRTLGESNSIRDSCLVALQNKQTEFERYKAFNDRIVDYDKLKPRLNETLGLLAQKEIDIKEGLKVKAYEISIVKEKHDELVKQSLLTTSHYEGLVSTQLPTLMGWTTFAIPRYLKRLYEIPELNSFALVHELSMNDADFSKLNSLEEKLVELDSDKAEFDKLYVIKWSKATTNYLNADALTMKAGNLRVCSKLVSKVVPPADKTATSRQGVGLLLSPSHNNAEKPKGSTHGHSIVEIAFLRPASKKLIGGTIKMEMVMPHSCGVESFPHAHAQTTIDILKASDSRIMK
ncbi:integrase, catalytic region, zinc finger, CCHC-type containing protein [Tanacetum coccineum]